MARVCVATDDLLYVKLGHFGDARFYVHYEPAPRGKWRVARIVENPLAGLHDTEEEGKRDAIYELNRDCTVIVATFFGPGGREYMESHGLKVLQVKPGTTVLEALERARSLLDSSV